MKVILDEWQKEILEAEGNILLCSGRQVGKSTIVSYRAGRYATQNSRKSVLIISATERQAEELFIKVLDWVDTNCRSMIKRGKSRPTKHMLRLNNGSVIRCLPTGISGLGIRGYTIDLLIADEAAFIPDEVWAAVTPMLLTTGGKIILVSTPFGQRGYFYESYKDGSFKVFHVNSEKVIRERPISATWTVHQKKSALEHLEREKRKMTRLQYAQEYMGEFVQELSQFFPDELIKKVCTLRRRDRLIPDRTYFLGVDVARLGDDEITFEILDKLNNEKIEQVESIIKKKQYLNLTTEDVLELEKKYKFKEIAIDDAGLGVGVFDYLLHNDLTKRKIVAINNKSRPLDRDETRHKKILKEDLYNNLKALMERGEIALLDDDEVTYSLKSIQFEYLQKHGEPTTLRIFGNNSHVVEGLIRAAWSAKDKHLSIWVRSS